MQIEEKYIGIPPFVDALCERHAIVIARQSEIDVIGGAVHGRDIRSGARVPRELTVPIQGTPVGKYARQRCRIRAVPVAGAADTAYQHDWIAGKGECRERERPDHEIVARRGDQIARLHINAVIASVFDEASGSIGQVADIKTAHVRLVAIDEKQKAPGVRQEMWPSMPGLVS